MKHVEIPARSYQKYNATHCKLLLLSMDALDKLQDNYHQLRGLPTFVEDLIHLNPESNDLKILTRAPDLMHWAEDGSFLIIPNTPYIDTHNLDAYMKDSTHRKGGFALNAWYIHPKILEETVFSSSACRKDLSKALTTSKYIAKLKPSTHAAHTKNQKRIREIEVDSGIPYFASVFDLTPDDVPWLKKLKHDSLSCLKEQYGVNDDSHVALFFHTLIPQLTTTLHLHIRVNQGIHPLDKANSIDLDDLIHALEHGKTVKDILMDKGYQYRHLADPGDFICNSGIKGISTCSPYIMDSPYIAPEKKTLYSYKYEQEKPIFHVISAPGHRVSSTHLHTLGAFAQSDIPMSSACITG